MPYTYTPIGGNTQEFETEAERDAYKRWHLGIIAKNENKHQRVDARLAFDFEAEAIARKNEEM